MKHYFSLYSDNETLQRLKNLLKGSFFLNKLYYNGYDDEVIRVLLDETNDVEVYRTDNDSNWIPVILARDIKTGEFYFQKDF